MRWIISEDVDINRAFRWGMIFGLFMGWILCDIERADIEGLRKSIQDYLDGDYPNPRKHRYDESDDKCPHCRYWYEDCGACIEEHFILELKS